MSSLPTEGWITAYDAVAWEKMPKDGAHFLYVDGRYAAPAAAHAAYPDAYTIAIEPTTPADEYDVEKGNPDHPVTWAVMMRQRYDYLGRIYCSLATVGQVLDQFTTAGLAPPRFRIADWTDTPPALVPNYGAGTDGVQYATGPDYDTSLLHPALPRYNRPTAAPAAPHAPEDDEMPMATSNPNGTAILSWAAGRCHVVQVLAVPGSGLVLGATFYEVAEDNETTSTWSGEIKTSAAGQAVFEIPTDKIKGCRGVYLDARSGTGPYAVSAV